jgi:hypothetical protein
LAVHLARSKKRIELIWIKLAFWLLARHINNKELNWIIIITIELLLSFLNIYTLYFSIRNNTLVLC